ncbi:hypothetical protein EK904_006704, partial [Melospiza melodia maxima]
PVGFVPIGVSYGNVSSSDICCLDAEGKFQPVKQLRRRHLQSQSCSLTWRPAAALLVPERYQGLNKDGGKENFFPTADLPHGVSWNEFPQSVGGEE